MDIGALLEAAAERKGIPLVALVALGQAESGWDRRAARWGTWPDVSFGYGQITVRLALSYGIGDGTAATAQVVQTAMLDRERSVEVMADYYRICLKAAAEFDPWMQGDTLILQGLICYNSGRPQEEGNWYWEKYAANIEGYRRALTWAHEKMED